MQNLFWNVVRLENDHTQLLRNLMVRYPNVAAKVLSILTGETVAEEEAAKFNFRTQAFFAGPDGRQIPDIVAEGDGFECIVEVKIDPYLGLTDKQEEGYATCFSGRTRKKYLSFLVPNNWKYPDHPLNLIGVPIRRCSWQNLVSELAKMDFGREDELLREAIDFWNWRFEMIRMEPEERDSLNSWSGTTFRALRKLGKAVDQTKGLFDAKGAETEAESIVRGYGFYIKRGKQYVLYVGIWDQAPSPLSFCYHLDSSLWIKPTSVPADPTIVERHNLWAIPQDAWDNPERIYELLSTILKEHFPS